MVRKISLLTLILVFFAQVASAAVYKVDPVHSQIQFTVDHLMIFKVSGVFTEFQGEVEVDAANNALQSARATIEVASIDTREPKRDDHLRSADFFDVANHPTLTFVSKKVEGEGSAITVHGDLTIRGTTRPIVLTGSFRGANTDPWGNVRAGYAASGTIDRRDFGLTWNKALETGGMVVGNEVVINLEVQAIKAQ
ncbi:MAG: YceI family protein [Desulfuromonadales bacterium]|nr:YceI family protein [Desulfuromonadales bacterium]